MTCKDKKCVFHKDEYGCYLPENENFFIVNNQNEVSSCLNRIHDENDLSFESKLKLKELKENA